MSFTSLSVNWTSPACVALGGGSRMRGRNAVSVRLCTGTKWGMLLGSSSWERRQDRLGVVWVEAGYRIPRWTVRDADRPCTTSVLGLDQVGTGGVWGNRPEAQEKQGFPRFRNSDGLASAPAWLTASLLFLSLCHQLSQLLGCGKS